MAALIEDQIHRVFLAQEEERVRLLKQEGKPVSPRAVPKPWRRMGPHALLQEPSLLALVSEYDYDLGDEAFREYCVGRGVMHVAGQPGSARWGFFADWSKTRKEFLADPSFRFAEEHHGRRHEYAAQELVVAWQIVVLGRGTLQDAWELHRRDVVAG